MNLSQRNTEHEDPTDESGIGLPPPHVDLANTYRMIHPVDLNMLSPFELMQYNNTMVLHERIERLETSLVNFMAATAKSIRRDRSTKTAGCDSGEADSESQVDDAMSKRSPTIRKKSGQKIPLGIRDTAKNILSHANVDSLRTSFKSFIDTGEGQLRLNRNQKARLDRLRDVKSFFDTFLPTQLTGSLKIRCANINEAEREELYISLGQEVRKAEIDRVAEKGTLPTVDLETSVTPHALASTSMRKVEARSTKRTKPTFCIPDSESSDDSAQIVQNPVVDPAKQRSSIRHHIVAKSTDAAPTRGTTVAHSAATSHQGIIKGEIRAKRQRNE